MITTIITGLLIEFEKFRLRNFEFRKKRVLRNFGFRVRLNSKCCSFDVFGTLTREDIETAGPAPYCDNYGKRCWDAIIMENKLHIVMYSFLAVLMVYNL